MSKLMKFVSITNETVLLRFLANYCSLFVARRHPSIAAANGCSPAGHGPFPCFQSCCRNGGPAWQGQVFLGLPGLRDPGTPAPHLGPPAHHLGPPATLFRPEAPLCIRDQATTLKVSVLQGGFF